MAISAAAYFVLVVQGAEAKDTVSSKELTDLRSALEVSKAEAQGHSHALQELSVQAQACCCPHACSSAVSGACMICVTHNCALSWLLLGV